MTCVNYVYDRTDADVQILVTAQRTAGLIGYFNQLKRTIRGREINFFLLTFRKRGC